MLHFLLDHTAPAETMIRQLTIPLVVVVCHFTFSEDLLGRLGFGPCFSAGELVRIAFLRWIVPRIEQLARITTLRLTISLSLLHSVSGGGVVVRLSLIFGNFNLLHGIINGHDRLK